MAGQGYWLWEGLLCQLMGISTIFQQNTWNKVAYHAKILRHTINRHIQSLFSTPTLSNSSLDARCIGNFISFRIGDSLSIFGLTIYTSHIFF